MAKAFLNKPEILFLDEPTASLDPITANYVRKFLLGRRDDHNLSIIFTSHNMAEVEEVCDRVIFLDKGKIVDNGTPEELARTIEITHVNLLITEGEPELTTYCKKQNLNLSWQDKMATIDLLTWGLTGTFINTTSNDPTLKAALICGLMLLTFLWRAQYEVSINLLTELWDKNLVNILITPISFSEWIASSMILSILKGLLSFSLLAVLSFFIFNVSIIQLLGWNLLIAVPILFMTGWWIGFLISGIIFRFGIKVQSFGWTLIWLIAPLSAIYFPIATLPVWSQNLSLLNPARYVFENVRLYLHTGSMNWDSMVFAFLLNIIFCILSYTYMKSEYEKLLKRKGLIKFN